MYLLVGDTAIKALLKFLLQSFESGLDFMISLAENNPASSTFLILGVIALIAKYIIAFIEF